MPDAPRHVRIVVADDHLCIINPWFGVRAPATASLRGEEWYRLLALDATRAGVMQVQADWISSHVSTHRIQHLHAQPGTADVARLVKRATGAGYSFRLLKTDKVSVGFFGDGAVNNGAFHEALNLAAIWGGVNWWNRRVFINTNRFNSFNRTRITNNVWNRAYIKCARVVGDAEVAGISAVVTEVEGNAFRTGEHTFTLDPEDPPTIFVDILGQDLGMLIGRRGDHLSQLQYLVNLIANAHHAMRRHAQPRRLLHPAADRPRQPLLFPRPSPPGRLPLNCPASSPTRTAG